MIGERKLADGADHDHDHEHEAIAGPDRERETDHRYKRFQFFCCPAGTSYKSFLQHPRTTCTSMAPGRGWREREHLEGGRVSWTRAGHSIFRGRLDKTANQLQLRFCFLPLPFWRSRFCRSSPRGSRTSDVWISSSPRGEAPSD